MDVKKLFVGAISWQDLSEELCIAFNLHHEVRPFYAIHGNCLLQNNSKALTNNSDKEIEHENDTEIESNSVNKEVSGRFYHVIILSTSQQVDLVLSNSIVFSSTFCLA